MVIIKLCVCAGFVTDVYYGLMPEVLNTSYTCAASRYGRSRRTYVDWLDFKHYMCRVAVMDVCAKHMPEGFISKLYLRAGFETGDCDVLMPVRCSIELHMCRLLSLLTVATSSCGVGLTSSFTRAAFPLQCLR